MRAIGAKDEVYGTARRLVGLSVGLQASSELCWLECRAQVPRVQLIPSGTQLLAGQIPESTYVFAAVVRVFPFFQN